MGGVASAVNGCAPDISVKVAARNIVTANSKSQLDGLEQGRWAYLFDEGLIDVTEADVWANAVWREATDRDDGD